MSIWIGVFCSASEPPTLLELGEAIESLLRDVRVERFLRDVLGQEPAEPDRPWHQSNETAQIIFRDDRITPPERYGVQVSFSPRRVADGGYSWCDNWLRSIPDDLSDEFPDVGTAWLERIRRMVETTEFEMSVRYPLRPDVPSAWIDLVWTLAQWVGRTYDGVMHLPDNGLFDPADRQLIAKWR